MPETQAGASTPDILSRIVRSKETEVTALRARVAELRAATRQAPPARDFLRALTVPGHVTLIAEVKRRSPGAGAIRPHLSPKELAREYESAGAAALSVLTDGPWFGGSLDDLREARATVSIPVLRKDFTIADEQVLEARAAGADAILLIVRILEDAALRGLRETAEAYGMAALVEAHDAQELDRALASGARILGINNRDLATFTTRLDTTLGLASRIPEDVLLVSESGIRSREDVTRLGRAGVDAVLVGETLLRAESPAAKARELLGSAPEPAAP